MYIIFVTYKNYFNIWKSEIFPRSRNYNFILFFEEIMDGETCCICLEMKPVDMFITYGVCKHSNTCVDCYIAMHYPNINSYRDSECSMCRTKSENWKLRYIAPIEKCKYYEPFSDDMFKKIIKMLMSVKKPSSTKLIISGLLELFTSFETQSKFYFLLSKDQTEILLGIVKDRNMNEWDECGYRFFNVLVSMCYEPWLVDRKLGSHGICYHGNFGEHPTLIQGLILIQHNIKSIKKNSYH